MAVANVQGKLRTVPEEHEPRLHLLLCMESFTLIMHEPYNVYDACDSVLCTALLKIRLTH